MEIILFTLVAICLYLFSDWLLQQIEIKRGRRFKSRTVIFFLIIMVLSIFSFNLLKAFLQSGAGV